jgi:tRNA-2-methylthio-N6-dimethylallyladenosine synthase
MDERLQRLQAASTATRRRSTRRRSASALRVLIERKGKLPGQMLGKSPWLQSVHIWSRCRDRPHVRRHDAHEAAP